MIRTLLALGLSALSVTASAEALSYNWIEGGYTRLAPDGGAPDADGVGINGSFALGERLFVFGGWSKNDFDGTSVDVDVRRIGLGWRTSISDRSDLLLSVNHLRYDVDVAGFAFDTSGYEAEVGVRSRLGDRFEGQLGLGYSDGGDFSGDLYGKLSGTFRINANWGLVGTAVLRDEVNEYFIGPRLSF